MLTLGFISSPVRFHFDYFSATHILCVVFFLHVKSVLGKGGIGSVEQDVDVVFSRPTIVVNVLCTLFSLRQQHNWQEVGTTLQPISERVEL